MIDDLARSIISVFGFGSMTCRLPEGDMLASQLRSYGIPASIFHEANVSDYLITDMAPNDAAGLLAVSKLASKGCVFRVWSHEKFLELVECAYRVGFCMHPRSSVFEKLTWKTSSYYCALSFSPPKETFTADLSDLASLVAEISSFAGRSASVCVLGENRDFASKVLDAHLLNAKFSDEESDNQLDLLVLVVDRFALSDINGRFTAIFKRITSGGRLALAIRSETTEYVEGNMPSSSMNPENFIPETLIAPNEAQFALRKDRWLKYSISEQRYWVKGWQGLTFMKCPLVLCDSSHISETVKYNHNYSNNPILMRSLISVESRIQSGYELEALAEKVIGSHSNDADTAGAYCVKIYAMLSRSALKGEICDLLDDSKHYTVVSQYSEPILCRWAVSLSFAFALVYSRFGEDDSAALYYERCATIDFMAYSPTLSTKTIKACQLLAFRSLANNDLVTGRRWLAEGIRQSVKAASSMTFKDGTALETYILPELSQAISLGAQCNGALSALEAGGITPHVWTSFNCDIVSQLVEQRADNAAFFARLVSTFKS